MGVVHAGAGAAALYGRLSAAAPIWYPENS